ncbi:gamma-glutamyl hydrolase-like isoform X2 [Thrips palmi]|nr:gamma-glutamyl hydrolase-like isoform X2 [Thrips palmi]
MTRNNVVVAVAVAALLCALVGVGTLAQRRDGARVDDSGRFPPQRTDRPIIGVLSMELSPTIEKVVGAHHSYIAASYVKFVEGAGAQVAPILIGQPAEYYRKMVDSVNGLLLPGGATYFKEEEDNKYFAAGRQLYDLAKEANAAGAHFPVLGICLGMELLMVAAAGNDFRDNCDSEDPLPLGFLPGAKSDSRLFARAPPGVVHTLEKQNVTVNHHHFCITRRGIEEQGLEREWRTLSVNEDPNGVEFVSAFEHRQLPLYGVQFHPEKNIYEWKASKNYPHSESAITAARYFADFLVSEARKNAHSFGEDERDHLIYQYQPQDTKRRLMWEQLYLFEEQQQQVPLVRMASVPEPAAAGQPDFEV